QLFDAVKQAAEGKRFFLSEHLLNVGCGCLAHFFPQGRLGASRRPSRATPKQSLVRPHSPLSLAPIKRQKPRPPPMLKSGDARRSAHRCPSRSGYSLGLLSAEHAFRPLFPGSRSLSENER